MNADILAADARMAEPSKSLPLAYESPQVPASPNRYVLAVLASILGSLAAIVACGSMALLSDGPVWPLTTITAPLWILIEHRIVVSDGAIFLLGLVGGPMLYAMYAVLIVKIRQHRLVALTGVILFHLACVVYVCHLRDVWGLL